MHSFRRTTMVLVSLLWLGSLATTGHAQQWKGAGNATGAIWRQGSVTLGAEPATGSRKPLLELRPPLSGGSELLFSARSTYKEATGELFEVDDLRAYAGGARSKADLLSSTADLAVHRNAVIGVGKLTERVPSDYALAVAGKVLAEEVRVRLIKDWADYALDPAYRLKSLHEVEEHIRVHRRLPDIPSASDVATNGVDLGEMQAKLLLKIEELTLYMIEQQKTIAALQRRLAEREQDARSGNGLSVSEVPMSPAGRRSVP